MQIDFSELQRYFLREENVINVSLSETDVEYKHYEFTINNHVKYYVKYLNGGKILKFVLNIFFLEKVDLFSD